MPNDAFFEDLERANKAQVRVLRILKVYVWSIRVLFVLVVLFGIGFQRHRRQAQHLRVEKAWALENWQTCVDAKSK